MIGKRSKKSSMVQEKILDVDASMQGSLVFRDPVNLKISGKFEGSLTTKGSLTVGENAEVNADIIGEAIVIAGTVTGDIIAETTLKLVAPARVIGNIKTAILTIEQGSIFHGTCQMIFDEAELLGSKQKNKKKDILSADEVARYLEVEQSSVIDWASSGRLPGKNENGFWRFDKSIIDEWIRGEKTR